MRILEVKSFFGRNGSFLHDLTTKYMYFCEKILMQLYKLSCVCIHY